MGFPYLPYPTIIYDIISCIDARCMTKILDVSPALERLAADGVYEVSVYVGADYDTGADVVKAAFAVIPGLERAIDELVF